MQNNGLKKLLTLILPIILVGSDTFVCAQSSSNNQADFQNWLKNNGQPVIAQNANASALPLSVTHSQTEATSAENTAESSGSAMATSQPTVPNDKEVSANQANALLAQNNTNLPAPTDQPTSPASKVLATSSTTTDQAAPMLSENDATLPTTTDQATPLSLAQNDTDPQNLPDQNNALTLAQNDTNTPTTPPPIGETHSIPPPKPVSQINDMPNTPPPNANLVRRPTNPSRKMLPPRTRQIETNGSANTPSGPPPINTLQQAAQVNSDEPTSPPPMGGSTRPDLPNSRPPLVAPIPVRMAKPMISRPKTLPPTFQQSQELMRRAAPPSAPPTPLENAAFNSMMKKNMPLTPEQVVRLRQLIDVSQRAAAVPANIPPKPVSSTLIINLAPGTTPPAIRLSQGYVSSLVFVDSSGAPWPIDSYDVGDPKATNIQWEPKSNVLLMQAVSPYSDSNMVIRLTGLPTPITLELVSGQRVVDYRVDIHVSGMGPNTKDLPIGVALPSSANQMLLTVLDGVAPAGSKLLTVIGGDAQAWLLGNKMYVRTRFTVLSPGWVGKMVSPDGMNAYELQRTSSILVSQYGQPVEFKVEGF